MADPRQTLTIRRPDDWHVHFRDGAMLRAVVNHTARQFARAIVMPNLVPPVVGRSDALAYRARILAALAPGARFQPLMTCYLTDDSDPDDLAQGFRDGAIAAVKLYPAHATTNSSSGVRDIFALRRVFARLEKIGMPLLLHGEVTDPDVDIFDREAVFLDRVLAPLCRDYPALKIVLEHATTKEAVAFVADGGDQIAATITAHHLRWNRNALFKGGLRPDAYCLPVLKRDLHRRALRRAATSGSAKFFLGTDSAPHDRAAKLAPCGCAGIFSAPYALASYATVFDEEGALDRFEGFASEHGARFYGLPLNEGTITLERREDPVPERLATVAGELVPFPAGEVLPWRIQGADAR